MVQDINYCCRKVIWQRTLLATRTVWLHEEMKVARTVPRIPCKVWRVSMLLALSKLKGPFLFRRVHSEAFGLSTEVEDCILTKSWRWERMACVDTQFSEMCIDTVKIYRLCSRECCSRTPLWRPTPAQEPPRSWCRPDCPLDLQPCSIARGTSYKYSFPLH